MTAGLPGLDARLDFVTVEMQDERLVGAPAQLDALALGCAQHPLRRRHAALRDAKLERAGGGSRAFAACHDRQRKARAKRDDSRDNPCCQHRAIVTPAVSRNARSTRRHARNDVTATRECPGAKKPDKAIGIWRANSSSWPGIDRSMQQSEGGYT